MKSLRLLSVVFLLAACGDDETGPGGSGGATSSASSTKASSSASNTASNAASTTTTTTTAQSGSSASTSGTGGAGGCREPGPDDKDRYMVVGYSSNVIGQKSKQFGVIKVTTAGDVSVLPAQFELGETADVPVAFTPDGVMGFTANDDGTLGVFTIDAAGAVTVVHAELSGDYYAGNAIVAPDGSYVLVLDGNTINNGGGVYRIDIACDGTLTDRGKILDAKTPHDLVFLSQDRAILAATEVPGAPAADSAVLLDLSGLTPVVLSSADAFGDPDANASWLTVTHDQKFALLGNTSFVATNSIGVVSVHGDALASAQIFDDIEDPFSIAASPFDNAAMYASGFGDAMFAMTYAPAQAMPFTIGAAVDQPVGAQLPGALAMIGRGTLAGRIFVSDVRGLYQLRFTAAGAVESLGVLELTPMNAGSGVRNIGIQK